MTWHLFDVSLYFCISTAGLFTGTSYTTFPDPMTLQLLLLQKNKLHKQIYFEKLQIEDSMSEYLLGLNAELPIKPPSVIKITLRSLWGQVTHGLTESNCRSKGKKIGKVDAMGMFWSLLVCWSVFPFIIWIIINKRLHFCLLLRWSSLFKKSKQIQEDKGRWV